MSNPPEEWRFLPHGFLQPAGDGDRACLYCRYFHYHPTFLCLPICAGHLHQGLVDNQKHPASAAVIGRQGRMKTPKKGHGSTPEIDLGLLLRYSVTRTSLLRLILRTTHRDEANCLLAQFDFELITCFQVEQGGVCLADQKVAIALHRGDVGQLPTTFT